MRVAIVTDHVPFVHGGAEVLVSELERAFLARDVEVETLRLPWTFDPPDQILDHMAALRLLDLDADPGSRADLVVATKFPAYLVRHPRKVVWLLHQHRSVYDLWGHPFGLAGAPMGRVIRDAIYDADRRVMAEARRIFTISENVSQRLERYLGISSSVLRPPIKERPRCDDSTAEPFLFFPSRISPLKRHHLVLEALRCTTLPVAVRFAGRGDCSELDVAVRRHAAELGLDGRARWLGWVGDAELAGLLASCRAVVFPPVDEDFGYVAPEAMAARKPVITCTDSGGVLELVQDGATGWVVAPTPEALAAAMDEAWAHPDRCRIRGERGLQRVEQVVLPWDQVVETLLACA